MGAREAHGWGRQAQKGFTRPGCPLSPLPLPSSPALWKSHWVSKPPPHPQTVLCCIPLICSI